MELQANGCAKTCCASFFAEPSEIDHGPEVVDMLVPLGDNQYTCVNWDPDTFDCTIYEDRPVFCREFPTREAPCPVEGCQATIVPVSPPRRKVGMTA